MMISAALFWHFSWTMTLIPFHFPPSLTMSYPTFLAFYISYYIYETQWTQFRGESGSWSWFSSEYFNVDWNNLENYWIWLRWDRLLVAFYYGYKMDYYKLILFLGIFILSCIYFINLFIFMINCININSKLKLYPILLFTYISTYPFLIINHI